MSRPLNIAVAGLGTVGATVVTLLARRADAIASETGRMPRVVAVSARDRTRTRDCHLAGIAWYDDPVDMAARAGADIFVELIGGAEGSARQAVETALDHGISVVTANKALLAAHGLDLARRAETHGAALLFEASSAGGIPVVKALREALAGNRISRISGILNGTCNYILTRMEREGPEFETCLKDAQRLGYAEADPTFDIGGFDTAHKLAILTSLAFATKIDAEAIHVEGISTITPLDLRMADELGYRIKLLGVAERTATGIEQRVHPTMVDKGTALAQVMDVTNAVSIVGDAVGELTLVGPGAGGAATASAVLADIAEIARGCVLPAFGRPLASLETAERAPMRRHEGGYYVRLNVVDQPGSIARIAMRMAEKQISLESILQRSAHRPAERPRAVPVVILTHATTEEAIREAIEHVIEDGTVTEPPQLIRIER